MKRSILFVTMALLGLGSFAQKHVYEDLLVMYVDESYEKCLAKAEGYTIKDDTKKDPLPYLYMSMSLFEMSKLEKYDVDYPNAFRDALKYAEKYRKKDKNNEFFANYEDYWAELNTVCMEEAENLFDSESWSKAKRYYDYMVSYYPENPGAWLMYGLTLIKYKQVREADEALKEYAKAYSAVPDLSRLPEDQKKLLRSGLIRYTEHLSDMGMSDSARATMDQGKTQFMEDPEFKALYEELN